MIKHLFFDLDRTLWDFEKNSEATLLDIYEKFQLKDRIFSPHQFVREYKRINAQYWDKYRVGLTTKEKLREGRFKDTLALFGFTENEISQKGLLGEYYIENSPKGTNLFPNTHESLSILKEKNYTLHIITNGFTEAQEVKLKTNNLNQYFNTILCSDTFGKNKPHPSIFNYALQQANTNADESVMIGDDLKADVLGAINVGMKAILFDPKQQQKQKKGFKIISNLIALCDDDIFN